MKTILLRLVLLAIPFALVAVATWLVPVGP